MNWLRKLFGVSKCNTLSELIGYIKIGDIYGLWNWCNWWIDYIDDKYPADNFRPAEQVIERAAMGIGDDCEGFAVVPYRVICSWLGWTARLIRLEREILPAHAICIYERPNGGRGRIAREGVTEFPPCTDWGKILDYDGWTRGIWIDEKGNKLPIVGWNKYLS